MHRNRPPKHALQNTSATDRQLLEPEYEHRLVASPTTEQIRDRIVYRLPLVVELHLFSTIFVTHWNIEYILVQERNNLIFCSFVRAGICYEKGTTCD